MKANHNIRTEPDKSAVVVVNINSSKDESKSQRVALLGNPGNSCCKYQ